ncbi:MAG: methyltransferase, partial [Stenotrophobium sp.]
NYFRLADFARMFGHVLEAGHLFGCQYIYVVAALNSLRNPAGPGLGAPPLIPMPIDLFTGLDHCAEATRAGTLSAVWGAAAKGVMFAHHLRVRGIAPTLAIDINPSKQSHYLAGSGLPVLPPLEALAQLGDTPNVFVMNSNYLSEIRAMGGPGPNYIAVDLT